MIRAVFIASVVALIPAPAVACAVCLTSSYGNRSFSWAFVILMLMPFVVAAGMWIVLLVLAGSFGGSLPDSLQKWRRQLRRSKPERQVAQC